MLLRRQSTDLRNIVRSLLGNIAQGFYLHNFVPRELRQHWKRIFPVQCCLQPLGQHWTRFLPVECCPKRIKTTFKRIFSWTSMSGASRTTLYRGFFVQCCPRSIKTTLLKIFSDPVLSGASWAKMQKVFTYAILSHEY